MAITEKDIMKIEEDNKKILYDSIVKLISKQSELIVQIGKIGQDVDIDTDVPNMAITFNNKLNQISHEFKRSGISMFAEYNEEYDIVSSNFVGDAIIDDMISKLVEGIQELSKYDSSIGEATQKRIEKIKALEEYGPIKRIFLKIRSFFVPNIISDLTSYSEEEIGEVNSHLSKYKEIDKKLWKYNLRDNVVQSLVKYINDQRYSDFTIPGLLKESVVPTLQKLGLEEVIPQLQEELSKSREQSLLENKKSWELSLLQKMEIQESSAQLAARIENDENIINSNQDKEYDEK